MIRIGSSKDIHRLEENGRPLFLAGIKMDYPKGPVSHSDGDVVFHALGEAFLGALALGDLGTFFPDNDDKYKNMNSEIILKECYAKVLALGYHLVNADISIICERPKLKNHILVMKENIARILNCSVDQISIKGQTNEKCGEIGKELAIESDAVVLIEK